jgi:hypothetical protein
LDGLLTDESGFPLMVQAFEGNKAKSATMLPVIDAFKTAHKLTDVTVVADAGMISEHNQTAIIMPVCSSNRVRAWSIRIQPVQTCSSKSLARDIVTLIKRR